ncbi:dTMP kinase [bacterium]|nr:dTMP kinase [bacterium]
MLPITDAWSGRDGFVLIAIEGIDGSGKGTQAKRLHEQLIEIGVRSELISFPRYSQTHFGRTIGRFLNGEFGQLDQVDPHLAATLYAADRFESLGMLTDLLATRDVVVSDRYVPSNIAHQGAKRSGEARQQLADWISTVEYQVFGLPQADLIIHLDLPAEIAQELIAKKSKRDYTDKAADLQEADRDYLSAVRQAYLDLAATEPNWQTVSLLDGARLRTIDEVAADIFARVQPLLPSS